MKSRRAEVAFIVIIFLIVGVGAMAVAQSLLGRVK